MTHLVKLFLKILYFTYILPAPMDYLQIEHFVSFHLTWEVFLYKVWKFGLLNTYKKSYIIIIEKLEIPNKMTKDEGLSINDH